MTMHCKTLLPKIISFRIPTSCYEANPKSWLQRLAFWFLKKSKCLTEHVQFGESFQYFKFDDKPIANLILQALQEIQFFDNNYKPKDFYCSGEVFSELLATPKINRYFTYKDDKNLRWKYGEIFSVNVHVIPWMKGWLLV